MSGPSAEEMEAKRQEMIASFKDIAAAMTRCVSIIEDYTRLSPSSLPGLMPIHQNISTLSASDIANAIGGTSFGLNAMSPEAEVKKRKPREKKIKDPNAPKRPPSAYILFQNEVRDKVRAENPGKAYKEILAVISEQWKKLPDAEKKVYESAYSDAQSSFRVQDDAYKAGQPTVPTPAPVEPSSEEDSSSSEESDSSDDESTTGPSVLHNINPTLAHTDAISPAMLSAPPITPNSSSIKKERKRKNKDEPVATPVAAVADKKQKKKKTKE